MESTLRLTVLRGMLVGADLLLCLLAFLFVHRQPSLPLHELALCLVAVLMGAMLSCSAAAWESTLFRAADPA